MTPTRSLSILITLLMLTWLSLPASANAYYVPAHKVNTNNQIQLLSVMAFSSPLADDISPANVLVQTDENWQATSQKQQLFLHKGINWFKASIYNPGNNSLSAYLLLGNKADVRSVNVFMPDAFSGLTHLFAKLQPNNRWATELLLDSHDAKTIYIEINSDIDTSIPFDVTDTQSFVSTISTNQYQTGFVTGGLIFIAVIFFLLYFAAKDATLLFLSAYFIFRALLLSVQQGSHLFYLFPEQPELRGIELSIYASASVICYLWFTAYLFRLKTKMPRAILAFRLVSLVFVVFIVASFFMPASISSLAIGVMSLGLFFMLALYGLYLHQQKIRIAFLYFVTMSIQVLFTVSLFAGVYFGLALFKQTLLIMNLSFTFNAILVVLLICRQYYYQLTDKHHAQKQALLNAVASKNANEKLLKVQTEAQEELEQRVQERTLELNIALNELEILNQELEQKNTIDELTGLYNRRFYDQRLLAEYRRSKRNLTPLSLVVVDLDYFKQVNDTYGHLAGDQCLSWLAQHIKQSLKRSTDIGCRYGGEEFCLILPDTELAGAVALAEELRKSIESFDFIYQDQHISLTTSCGVTTYLQQDNIEPSHIFFAADKALYRAKRNGRNQVQTQEISAELLLKEHSDD
ncbi:sensor domain-containing diguanylate cyclase [Colwellia sp. MEBiC06753]